MRFTDSSTWIDYLAGRKTPETQLLDELLTQPDVAVGDLVVAEVLQGFRDDHLFERAKAALLALPVVAMGGERIAVKAAQNYRFLRSQGITTRSTIDCLIATFCIEGGHELLHNDRDYDPYERLLRLRVLRP
jgi:hypothetical protein